MFETEPTKKQAEPRSYQAAVKRELAKLATSDLTKYVALVRLLEKTNTLVNRKMVEAIIETHINELCKSLNDLTRQVVNLAGTGKTREQKLELDRDISALMDSTLRKFRDGFVIPEIDVSHQSGERDTARAVHQVRQKAVKR